MKTSVISNVHNLRKLQNYWLDSSVGLQSTALVLLTGHGFKYFFSDLNFFHALISQLLTFCVLLWWSITVRSMCFFFITLMITDVVISFSAVQIYDSSHTWIYTNHVSAYGIFPPSLDPPTIKIHLRHNHLLEPTLCSPFVLQSLEETFHMHWGNQLNFQCWGYENKE